MDLHATPRILWEEATAILAANNVAADSGFGSAYRETLGPPPRYVWVPTRIRDEKELRAPRLGEPRPLLASLHFIAIDCWGINDAQAWAMAWNVLNACHPACTSSLKLESGEWVRPGAAVNQRGSLLR